MLQDAGRVLQEQPELGKLITSALAQYEASGQPQHAEQPVACLPKHLPAFGFCLRRLA